MAKSNGRFGPWSSVDIHIAGEPLAKDGLRKRRAALEKIVSPFVTTRKTADEIQFKGERRYLIKSPFKIGERNYHTILALQHLYQIEAARKANDIDKAVSAAVGFAVNDSEVQNVEVWKSRSTEALAFRARQRQLPSIAEAD
jgi:hypothetical protein